jgi:hypothetical protein
VEPDALSDSCTAKMSRQANPFQRSAGSRGRLLRFLYFLNALGAEVVAMLDVFVFFYHCLRPLWIGVEAFLNSALAALL